MIKFLAFDPFIKQLRVDRGWRVTFEVPESEYNKIKELPTLQGKELEINVKENS